MTERSPFSDNRFEHEIRHLYVVKMLSFYHRLEELKPTILVGARGTGKTTLLRSLSWRERISNPSLRDQLGHRRANSFIGIYIKIPEVHVVGLIEWLKTANTANVRYTLYSRYLELLVLQEVLGSLSALRSSSQIEIDVLRERGLLDQLISEHGSGVFLEVGKEPPPRTIDELRDEIRKVRKVIERAVQRGVSPEEARRLVGEPTGLFELAQSICENLSSIAFWRPSGAPISFKVCFDEAEALEVDGVSVLMTWIRVARHPLSFVASFVSRPSDWSQTLLPHLTVQKADAESISLDDLRDDEFVRFAEGVADLRIREFVRRESADHASRLLSTPFSAELLFGKLNLNVLLEWMLSDSESPLAKEISERASKMGPKASDRLAGRGDDSVRPIYQAYLEHKEVFSVGRNKRKARAAAIDLAVAPRWTKRKGESQHERKKMVAAYLSLARELNTDVRYAFAEMVLQLSDNCIRDFLSNVDCIFRASNASIIDFLRQAPIRPTIQHRGLKDASLAKRMSLPTLGVNRPSDIAKLVEGLGKLTRALQSGQSGGLRHLSSSERGIYKLELQATTTALERDALDLVIDAAEAGFLKIERQAPFSISFRIHTSLAAYFGLSYRGAYYETAIAATDILRFRAATDPASIEAVVKSLLNSIDGVPTADLFS